MRQLLTGKLDMMTVNLRDLTVPEIEGILTKYPWYAHARKELMVKMSKMGEEYRQDVLRRTALYVYPDYKAFRNAYILAHRAEEVAKRQPEPVYDFGLEEEMPVPESQVFQEASMEILPDTVQVSKKQIYIVGGDYFSNEDLRQVSGSNVETYSLNPDLEILEYKVDFDSSEFSDENYYTETLARIYAEQGLYSRAHDIYEKLILLYPEKSAYFATLKNEIKKHL